MNYPKIIKVTPQEDMVLFVEFESGEKKLLDIKPYLKLFKPFEELKDKAIFNKIKTDNIGRGLIWNSRVDLDGYDAWEFGVNVL
jgi:hypothetical protein